MTDQLIILLASTACIMALGMLINFILVICVPDIPLIEKGFITQDEFYKVKAGPVSIPKT